MESNNFGVGRTLRIAVEFVTLAILLLVGSVGAVTPTITTHQPVSHLDIIVGNTQNFISTITSGQPSMIISTNPITVTVNTPTNVTFTVTSAGAAVNGATVTLSGVATGSGTTDANGNANINVNATSPGTITATAIKTGYTSAIIVLTSQIAKDNTPPESITNLIMENNGANWIKWNWTNPIAIDFDYVAIWINNGWHNASVNASSFNTSGILSLLPGTEYTIATHTVDTSGNVNETWVNFSATVMTAPSGATKFIRNDATGGDCTSIGTWNNWTMTCTMTSDLIETIQIDSNGTILDGNGYQTAGSGTGYGVNLTGRSDVTIKNLNIRQFYYGIYLDSSNNNTFNGNNASNNSYGISLSSSNNNTLSGNSVSNNYGTSFPCGIFLKGNNNTLIGNNASNIECYYAIGIAVVGNNNKLIGNNANSNFGTFTGGISLSGNNNTLSGNNVSNNYNGIFYMGGNNTIYNNLFNNANNFGFASTNSNTWNTTKTPGINIIGEPNLGGNFWAYPNGTGFSQTCTDADKDGICDAQYTLDSNNIDYLPLAFVPAGIKGDLNGNGQSADAGDLVLMKRASIGEIIADSSYDLNNNGQNADAGDLVLMKRASIGEIVLQNNDFNAVNLSIPLTGIQSSIWDDGSVSLSIPLHNTGDGTAEKVELTTIEVPTGERIDPSSLPLALGDIFPNDIKKIDARFKLPTIGVQYPVIIRGTYTNIDGSYTFDVQSFFTPQQPSNAPITSNSGSIAKITTNNALYPSNLPPPQEEREFNGVGILPPLGQPRNLFITPSSATSIDRTTAFPLRTTAFPLQLDPKSVVFTRNTIGAVYGGFPPDPSVAGNNADDVVMFTANTGVSYSTDSGLTFKTVNLLSLNDPAIPHRNSFFPQDDGGLCCDQVLTYIPKLNLFVWLLQYWPVKIGGTSSTNRLRVAWAKPTDIKSDFLHAWTWVDLTSAGVGIGNDWMDYPDMAFSDNYLYVGVDHGITNTSQVYGNRHIFARLSLNDIADPNIPTVSYQYMDPSREGLYQNHIAQSSADTMYWTAMDTSTLTVYSWPDSSNSATPHDIKISSFSNTDYSAPTPEKIDWNAGPKMVLGATRVEPSFFCPPSGCSVPTRFLYFAFSAGRSGSGRPYPYVRVEKVDRDSFNLVNELDIWNPGFAFSMPALVSRPGNNYDEVAISLAIGGGGNFADNAVGFIGDYVVYVTTDSDTTHAGYARDTNNKIIYDSNGNPTYAVRFGDYYSARNSIGPITTNGRGVGYSTLGYSSKTNVAGKKCVDVGCSINLHYVQFGRNSDLIPPPPLRPPS